MIALNPVPHAWKTAELIGGDPAIDFANTVSGWGTDYEDWLGDYASFARWSQLAGFIDGPELGQALKAAAGNPPAAERIYAQMSELRFALIRLLHAVRDGGMARPGDMAVIDHWMDQAAGAFRLRQVSRSFQAVWSQGAAVMDKPLLAAARAIGIFLSSADFAKLKICALPTCGWFFVDASKNGRRRWCDMALCGNLAKARRFQARHRAAR